MPVTRSSSYHVYFISYRMLHKSFAITVLYLLLFWVACDNVKNLEVMSPFTAEYERSLASFIMLSITCVIYTSCTNG